MHKDYGVADERKRVFYIGFRKDLNIKFDFPIGSTTGKEKKLTLREVIWDLQKTAVPLYPKIKEILLLLIRMNISLVRIHQYL